MTQDEINLTNKRYNERLEKYGVSQKALGWLKERSAIRFKALIDHWGDITKSKVLDFGCGFGDLYGYILESGQEVNYIGIDINDKLLSHARELYPSGSFIEGNLLEDSIPEGKVDYSFVSGVFNHQLDDNMTFVKNVLLKLSGITERGIGMNFLSDKVDFKSDHNFHASPSEILDICYSVSNNVVLKNDYMPFEFTVLINKGDGIVKDLNIYESSLSNLK